MWLTGFDVPDLDVMYFIVHVEGVSSIHVKEHVYVPYWTE